MAVVFENLIVANGTFKHKANIEAVTVPASTTIAKGTVMGKITASGKYIVSLLAAIDGSEVAVAVTAEEIVNTTGAPVDIASLLYKAGSFNSLGITFGTGQTLANTKDSLHNVSIEITNGVL